ncbi:MAG: hypothetical protein OEY94_10150 [Alphaproteobacteria bacterium]|nr:hypothetical protein [Alphaproteobacteria bacterium]
MRRFLILPLFCFCLLASNISAHANEADITTLKKIFQDMLDYQTSVMGMYGDFMTIKYDGDLVVTPEDNYYKVTFPNISLNIKDTEDGAEETFFNLGVVTINAVRGDEAGTWKTMISYPKSFTFNSPNDDETIQITIGDQNTAGILEERLGYFTKLDMKTSDIKIAIDGKLDEGLTISNIDLFQNLSSQDGAYYSGLTNMTLKNLAVNIAEEGNFSLGELTGSFNLKDIKLPTLNEYKEKITSVQGTMSSMIDPENAENISEQEIMKMMGSLYDFDLDGFSIEYGIKNLIANEEDHNFALDSGKFGLSLTGLKAENGSAGVVIGFDGLKSSDEKPEYKDITPRQANINLSASNIPISQLSELVTTTMESISANPEMAQMAGIGIMMKVPMLLSNAGTKIEIKDTYAKGNAFSTDIKGEAKADIKAMTSVTADLKSIVVGLDTVLEIANQYKESDFFFANLANKVDKLKTIGAPATSADGQPAHEFHFQIKPEGQTLINGKDAQTLMMP